jgi:hypothetical protein
MDQGLIQAHTMATRAACVRMMREVTCELWVYAPREEDNYER